MESWRGQLIRRVLDLRFAREAGIRFSLDEIPADEFLILRLLAGEQERNPFRAPGK